MLPDYGLDFGPGLCLRHAGPALLWSLRRTISAQATLCEVAPHRNPFSFAGPQSGVRDSAWLNGWAARTRRGDASGRSP